MFFAWIEINPSTIGDVINVSIVVQIADPRVLAFSMFKLNEFMPIVSYVGLAGIEIESTKLSLFGIRKNIQIAVAIPVVQIDTVRPVIFGIGANHIASPAGRTGFPTEFCNMLGNLCL